MGKIYKGWELMKAIADGEIKEGSKIKTNEDIIDIKNNEKKREIATLKVLGFYNNEVDNYITKENIILTLLGIVIGLIFGYFLTNAVVSTVEIENARFIHQIKVASYIYSVLLSIMFTVIVNIITHFNLKKIDMIESLKSVE